MGLIGGLIAEQGRHPELIEAFRQEVSEYEPDRVFALRMVEGALPIDARLAFEPTGIGTRVRFDAHGQPTGALRLAQPLLRITLKRQFGAYCTTLKRLLENSPPPA